MQTLCFYKGFFVPFVPVQNNIPHNSCLEVINMIDGADLQDLLLILEQVEDQKQWYTPKEMKDILFCITKRRETIESQNNYERIKKK